MAIHEVIISAKDNTPPRVTLGDVIAVRPHPWSWGRKEIDGFLILLIEDSRTSKELESLARGCLYAGNEDPDEVENLEASQTEARIQFVEDHITNNASPAVLKALLKKPNIRSKAEEALIEAAENAAENAADSASVVITPRPSVVAKRRHYFDMNAIKVLLPELDIDKVKNTDYIYQPFKKASQVAQKFSDIDEAFIDCGETDAEVILPEGTFDALLTLKIA